MRKAFNGSQENEIKLIPLIGKQVFEWVEDINTIFGKTQKKLTSEKNIWKKRSIFFDLPYWSDLDVRHCIDVMHVEKSVRDSVINMLLNIKGKTKYGLNTHQDLVEMGICDQLHPRFDGKKIYLPPTCHTLLRNDKICFC